MELDEQLAALAAGELDDTDARALQARVAADPALARRVARLRRLDELLTGWDPAPMSDAAQQRLDAAVDEALEELDDGALVDRPPGSVSSLPTALDEPGDPQPTPTAGTGSSDGGSTAEVVDLARERERRGLPAWVPAATVAAALVGVVGIGIGLSGLTGSDDLDVATESSDDSGDVAEQDTAELFGGDDAADGMDADGDDGAAADTMESAPAPAQDEGGAPDTTADTAGPGETAGILPPTATGVELAEGELLELAARAARTTDGDDAQDDMADDEAADDEAADPRAETCVDEALLRDTPQAEDRIVELLADGSYADQEAVFVVVRTPGEPGDLLTVLAYDPADCSLLATAETSG